MTNFEDYLADYFISNEFYGVKDMLPDACNEWMAGLDAEEWLMHGQMWMSQTMHELIKRTNA